ncbi:MAG: Ribosomal RNA small subunit methyltransferase E [Candidatus Anoxychlamydiales bacterium]|nr:Ribosomal RNA small subunit methyltransferase E [Candidatus Anoxychlamydiales bacterium]
MPKDRYFSDQDLKNNASIQILDKEAHHMKIAMRKKPKDIVEIINGRGFLAKARIEKIKSKSVELKIERVSFEKEPIKKTYLACAFLKMHKLDLILEKCTELGCTNFWFYKSQNSEKLNISENRLDRMRSITIAAIKQCSRLYLPKIEIFSTIDEIKKIDGNIYFGDLEKGAVKYLDIFKKDKKSSCFFIGPEAGFSKEETKHLKSDLKAKGIKLNKNILRAESAAIAAIAIEAHLQLL